MSAQPARSPLHLVPDRPPGAGLTDFALWLRANGCSERTITDRLDHLADFIRHNPSFPNVSPMHIVAWLGREGYAPWSRATYFGHLRSYFTFAVEMDVLAVDPMARMRRPTPPRDVPRPLTEAQAEQVLTAAANGRNPNLATWLTLSLYAGLRTHEIAKLRGEDVDERNIHVVGKGGVGADIPTHPRIWALAQTRPRTGWWFPTSAATGHVTPPCVSLRTSRLFADNGIEGSIHRCRHTYATRLLRAGVNIRVVQELMRHKSLASTQIYTAVDEDERRDGIRRLGAGVAGVEGRSFKTEASAANYVARKAREARADALRSALATRHATATLTEDGREDSVRYLAGLANVAREAAAGGDASA